MERTLSLVKPDGVERNLIGEVIRRFETAGLVVVALKMVRLDERTAAGFYHVHRDRPFFRSLMSFMSSGPIVAMVIEGKDAIARVRALMGATDPAKADPGTIRKDHATSIERNVVHGSDSPATAAFEVGYFFDGLQIHPR